MFTKVIGGTEHNGNKIYKNNGIKVTEIGPSKTLRKSMIWKISKLFNISIPVIKVMISIMLLHIMIDADTLRQCEALNAAPWDCSQSLRILSKHPVQTYWNAKNSWFCWFWASLIWHHSTRWNTVLEQHSVLHVVF